MVQNWAARRGSDRDVDRRTRQIKEIVRLGSALRAEMSLEAVLKQVVEAISSTIGFGAAVLNLVYEGREFVEIVATAGLNEYERNRLIQSPPPVSRLLAVMLPEFRISNSYFISHLHKHLLAGVEGVTVTQPLTPNTPDAWHPEDALLVPLVSPQEQRLLGILSLDQPEDGKVPSLETIEIVEMFANQTALAISTSRLFEERERERKAMEDGIFELLYQLEQVRHGNLNVRIQLSSEKLGPVAGLLDVVLSTVSSLLTDAREASVIVSHDTSAMSAAATSLAQRAEEQNQQIRDISAAIESLAETSNMIAATARESSAIANDALVISSVGREAAERAASGMSSVREMALQSVKKMKRLGESAQDIGEIVQMVADFASQTNLLALNATIEAARAGEHGRGFAIVAKEIRNLAISSAEATQQIHARIRGIQAETNNVVVAIEHSTQQVVMQSELASQAGSALEEVDAVTRKISVAINDMNETAIRQAEAAVGIAANMAGVSGISMQTRESLEQMRVSMEKLVERSRSLLDAISVFRLNDRDQQAGPRLLPPASALHASELSTQPIATVSAAALAEWQRAQQQMSTGGLTAALPRVDVPVHPPAPEAAPAAGEEMARASANASFSGDRFSAYSSGPLPKLDSARANGQASGAGEPSQNSGSSPVPRQEKG